MPEVEADSEIIWEIIVWVFTNPWFLPSIFVSLF
jgi:hypothetical protein